jgi:branched-chain amino acid transport system permease protein
MLLQQIANGLMLGCTYSLVALGFTLIFGLLNLINLAHGEIMMVGAYVGLTTIVAFKLNIAFGILAAIVGTAIIGIIIYFFSIRYVERGGHLSPLISTIGVAIILQEAVTKIYTGEKIGFPETFLARNIDLGWVSLNTVQAFIILFSLLIMALFSVILKWTVIGKSIRAVSENPLIASLLGVNVRWIVIATFAIASMLAGIAGVLIGIAYHSIYPLMGIEIGLKGLAVIIIAGMGNIYGAMVCGILLGLVEIFSTAYLSSSYKDAFAFGFMVLVLIIKPSGLFGTMEKRRA